MKTLAEVLQVRRMGTVTRFHTIPTIRPQTTAHHSGNVALMMVFLWPEVTFNALKAALLHDLGESYTGDVPAPTKWASSEIKRNLEVLESLVMRRIGLPLPALSGEELWWLSFCDTFDLCCYCLEEIMLGNAPLIQQFENGRERLVILSKAPGAPATGEEMTQRLFLGDYSPQRLAREANIPFHRKDGALELINGN